MNILNYLRSRVKSERQGGFRSTGKWDMETARASSQVGDLVTKYVKLLGNATTASERNRLENNFMTNYRKIQENEKKYLKGWQRPTVRQRATPKGGRPPRSSPRFTAARNKLMSNLRAELKKLTNARNYYQRAANKIQSQINAIVSSRQRS